MAQNLQEALFIDMLVRSGMGSMAGNNVSWEADSLRIFGSTNSQAWPFTAIPISTDGIGSRHTEKLVEAYRKSKGQPCRQGFSTKPEASRLHPFWTVAQATVGRGAGFDVRFLDPILGSTFADIKGVSKAPNFGSDRKIRLAGGTAEYCERKFQIVRGEDNSDYLLWLIWADTEHGLCEYRVNLTKVCQAYSGKYKVLYTRPHNLNIRNKDGEITKTYPNWDLDWKYASIHKFVSMGKSPFQKRQARIRHHQKVVQWLYDNGCVDSLLPVAGQDGFDGDWSPWKVNLQKTWWF